jgi:hypothetical protein
MDYNRLREACELELERICQTEFENGIERHVNAVFDAAREFPGADDFFTTAFLPIPVIGEPGFWAGFDTPELRQLVVAALIAREKFRETAPVWAPPLPLRYEDCEALQDDDDPRLNLVGFFGASLRLADFDCAAHPCFHVFSSGMMGYEHAPLELRSDRKLRLEFPPKKLEGLTDGVMRWRSEETIAFDRDMLARAAEMAAAGRQV